MEKIEAIALNKLSEHLYDAIDRIRKDKVEDMTLESLKHNVFFVQSDLTKAIETLKAIEENNPQLFKQ